MLNFAICDDNVNILDKFSKILENIFVKHGYDAKVDQQMMLMNYWIILMIIKLMC